MPNAKQRMDELHNFFFVICKKLPEVKLAGFLNIFFCYINVANAGKKHGTITAILKVANSHAYGVILTNFTCYSDTHAIDKFTHAFKKNHTHTHAILKNRK